MKRLIIVLLSLVLIPSISLAREFDTRVDLLKVEYFVKADHSYEKELTKKITLLTPAGIHQHQSDAASYSPDTQELKLIDAHVVQPNGKKIKVTSDNIFKRSAQNQVPGFTNEMVTTVAFPQLQVGSQIVSKWKLIQKEPGTIEFNAIASAGSGEQISQLQMIIHSPENMELDWVKGGVFETTDKTNGKKRTITATLNNYTPADPENHMADEFLNTPYFIASAIPSWEKFGANFWKKVKDKIRVTSEVKQLALNITGDKRGLEAAQLLYNWVAQNIHYMSVSLDQAAGYEPHDVMEIINNGYGDCKDNVVLLSSLLKAINIKSEPVLISESSMFDVPEIPIEMTNHAIIYLPDYDLFADPTNQYASFGALTETSSNKFVIISGKKPRVAYTPESSPKNNQYEIKNKITLDKNGNFHGENTMNIFGRNNTDARATVTAYDSSKMLAEDFLSITQEGGSGDIKYTDPTDLNRHMELRGEWDSPLAVNMGEKVFFSTPAGIDFKSAQNLRSYITYEERKFPTLLNAAKYHWEYEIKIPNDYKITYLPENIKFKNLAGTYQSTYDKKGNKILVKRDFTINKDVYSAKEYADLKELIYKPINDARAVMALEKS